jgi:hypothetical protein
MRQLLTQAVSGVKRLHSQLDVISSHVASSLLGKEVSVQTLSHELAHGVVAGVVVESGRPKIIVDGMRYDLSQVLTATPLALN